MADIANDGKPEAPKGAPASRLVECVVAPRRTVQNGDKRHGPGSILRLEKEDVLRLRALGYLTNPAAPDVAVVTGDMPRTIVGG
jgi:hypothetical protein